MPQSSALFPFPAYHLPLSTTSRPQGSECGAPLWPPTSSKPTCQPGTPPRTFYPSVAQQSLLNLCVGRTIRPPVAIKRETYVVVSLLHVLHPERVVSADWARQHEMLVAYLPSLLGASWLQRPLVVAESASPNQQIDVIAHPLRSFPKRHLRRSAATQDEPTIRADRIVLCHPRSTSCRHIA